VHVQLAGERSEVAVNVSVGGKNQVHDTFALVEHIAANARPSKASGGFLAAGACRLQRKDHRSQGCTWHRFAPVPAWIAGGRDARLMCGRSSRSTRTTSAVITVQPRGKLDDNILEELT